MYDIFWNFSKTNGGIYTTLPWYLSGSSATLCSTQKSHQLDDTANIYLNINVRPGLFIVTSLYYESSNGEYLTTFIDKQ